MHRHRPNIATINAAGRKPLPVCAVVFADVDLGQRRRIQALRIERIARDLAHRLAFQRAVELLDLLGLSVPPQRTIPSAFNKNRFTFPLFDAMDHPSRLRIVAEQSSAKQDRAIVKETSSGVFSIAIAKFFFTGAGICIASWTRLSAI